jgi:hypothetical protein
MPKAKKEIKVIKDTDKELVDFIIREIPNCFDSFPRSSIARSAVEKFLKELKEKL